MFERLTVESRFTENDAKRIFTQVLQALQFLHNEKKTAHRDLKVILPFLVLPFPSLFLPPLSFLLPLPPCLPFLLSHSSANLPSPSYPSLCPTPPLLSSPSSPPFSFLPLFPFPFSHSCSLFLLISSHPFSFLPISFIIPSPFLLCLHLSLSCSIPPSLSLSPSFPSSPSSLPAIKLLPLFSPSTSLSNFSSLGGSFFHLPWTPVPFPLRVVTNSTTARKHPPGEQRSRSEYKINRFRIGKDSEQEGIHDDDMRDTRVRCPRGAQQAPQKNCK